MLTQPMGCTAVDVLLTVVLRRTLLSTLLPSYFVLYVRNSHWPV